MLPLRAEGVKSSWPPPTTLLTTCWVCTSPRHPKKPRIHTALHSPQGTGQAPNSHCRELRLRGSRHLSRAPASEDGDPVWGPKHPLPCCFPCWNVSFQVAWSVHPHPLLGAFPGQTPMASLSWPASIHWALSPCGQVSGALIGCAPTDTGTGVGVEGKGGGFGPWPRSLTAETPFRSSVFFFTAIFPFLWGNVCFIL